MALIELLKKGGFKWSIEEMAAFEALKLAMSVEAVLIQEGRPIAYFSWVLSISSRLKSIYERQLMAIVLVVQRRCHFLLGRHVIIHTAQQSIRYVLDQRLVAPDKLCWVARLLGFDFEIQYKPGTTNRVADVISRREEDDDLLHLPVIATQLVDLVALK